jgi:hypothetical protein
VEGREEPLQHQPNGAQAQDAESPEDQDVIEARVLVADHPLLQQGQGEHALQPHPGLIEAVFRQAGLQRGQALADGPDEEADRGQGHEPEQRDFQGLHGVPPCDLR